MEPLRADDPRTIGPFRIIGRLGAGGMGHVLLGEDPRGARVACKVVRREIAAEPGFRERFRREVEIVRASPPTVTARYVDADPHADRPWLATEFIDGPSLRQVVQERGPLPLDQALPLLHSIASALAALHGAGVVHRDLTPSNVLLDATGPRLIDFGISRALGAMSMTITGQVLGTPSYMSPEQIESARGAGPASDVFALGSLITYLTTGRSPFEAGSVAATLYNVAHGAPDLDGVPAPLHDLVRTCLEKDPSRRPDIRHLVTALASLDPAVDPAGTRRTVRPRPARTRTLRSPRARRPGPRPARHRGRGPALAALALAAVGATAVVLSTGAFPLPAPAVPGGAGGVIDAEVDDRFGTDGPVFASPTGNIACAITADGARCDVVERSWVLPPRPDGCTSTYGTGVVLQPGRPGQLSCTGDALAAAGLEVLAYGSAVRYTGITCTSRETGVRCEEAGSAHGFEVARAAYRVF
jgi:predicted Ser/Thr protein kinase